MKYIDLHSHTIYSDGEHEPAMVIHGMKNNGIDIGAITDHDSMGGYFKAVDTAKEVGIQLIPGTEISTPDYHILGLNVDPLSERFQKFLERSRTIQEKVCNARIEKLQGEGVPITFKQVKDLYPGSRIGKGNIFATMMQDPACKRYVEQRDPGIHGLELFDVYCKRMKIPWVNNGAVPVDETINEIHAAGGIAIIAHPFKDVENMKELDFLVAEGLDGIEMQPNYGTRNDPFVQYAKECKLITTYGSDYHGSYQNRPLLGRGINQVESLDELFGVPVKR